MNANVAALLEERARRWPDKRVLISDGVALDWETVERRAGGVAESLAERGIVPGDRIAIALPDPMWVVVALFGALKAGATATPLNARLTESEQRVIIDDLDPKLVIETMDDAEADYPAREVAGGDGAIILYTSGSSGVPKGVLLSHAATAFALDSWGKPVMDLRTDDVSLAVLPLAHSLGIFGAVLAPMLEGASVAILPRFTPEDAVAAIERHRVTVFLGVPTMFRRIVDSPALARAGVSSLRYALSGAAVCPWELAQDWKKATGVRIVRGYGMTELFRAISYSAADEREVPESIGRAVPGVELRVVDDGGRTLAAGEAGELWVRSPARLTAYLNRDAETREVLEGDWFKTGDLATIDADGFVRIIGRKKEVIIRGGYTVSTVEVELVLMTHPAIAEAAVVPMPHHELGEEVVAFISLKPDAELRVEEVIEYCKARMAGYKYPREVRIDPELPKGPTGKILKAELKP